MEKRLTREELLQNLIRQLEDPFCSAEKYADIKNILFTSDTFHGVNHLFLAKLYLDGVKDFLPVDEKECLHQIELALKEGNHNAYFFLYLFYRKVGDFSKARNFLRLSYDRHYPDALLAMGKESMEGILFQKDLSFAYACFRRAIDLGRKKEGYYHMVLIDTMLGNTKRAREDYEKAKKDGVLLPGVVE